MNNNTLLVINYGDLRELLDAMQTDGLNADGCCCSLGASAEEEIEYGLKDGTIKILKDSKLVRKEEADIKFVSYTGKYPNLCSGVLTLLINGQEVKFGHDSKDWDWKTRMYNDDNYEDFWSSGGNCGFRNGYSESFVDQGEWRINAKELPEKFRKYAAEIEGVFNASVPHGCCGGCL